MLNSSSDQSISAMYPTEEGKCFHCGLPVEDENTESLIVFEQPRHFCCHGCQSVCKTIIDCGLEDYYSSRDLGVNSNQQKNLDQLLEKLSIYDNTAVQKSFVHGNNNWQEAYLILEGIRCSACVWLNELHLRQQPGVLEVHIDDITQRARVRWDPDQIALSQILATIVSIGYQAHPYEPSHYLELQKENKRKNLQRLLYAVIIGMIPMHFALATWFMGGADDKGQFAPWEQNGRWVSLFVTLSILLYPAQEFFFGVWSDLKRKVIGMDVPIVLGLSSAYLVSVYSTVTSSGEVYYESIVMFIMFILYARRLEQQARIQASDQLERLALAQPVSACRIQNDNSVEQVSVLDLQPGDRIKIFPGDQIPVDCIILQGESSFNESLITGESKPVTHTVGNRLMAGAINYDQPVEARVSASEMDSTIAEITRLAESGLENKPAQSLLADKVATYFVGFILMVALLTALFWIFQGNPEWLIITVSVLIVTCPCALSLSVPIALTLGASRFLKMGVLPLNMSKINLLQNIDMFVFDKTGTLTRGELKLVETIWLDESNKNEASSILKSLALNSEHPVAKALQKLDTTVNVEFDRVQNHVGLGLEGSIVRQGNTEIWRFGQFKYIAEFSGELTASAKHKLDRVQSDSCSISYLTRNSEVVAILLFEDSLRGGNQLLVQQLVKKGITPVILSGDAQRSVESLAIKLGITEYFSGMSPADKMHWVRQQQSAGKVVAMAGDGVNDAPTLAAADISFSLAEATGLANNHSDFLLLRDQLNSINTSIELATKTLTKIRQNIGWAIFYNVLAIPFAVMGLVPPWIAAVGMSLSSVIVVLNSMR